MSQQTIQRVCPYLGLAVDPASHLRDPDEAHRCFSPNHSGDITVEHQDSVCFSADYAGCSRFVALSVDTPPVPLDLPKPQLVNRAGLLVLLALLFIVPLAALIILPTLLAPAQSNAVLAPSVTVTQAALVSATSTPRPSATSSVTRAPAPPTIQTFPPIPTPPAGGSYFEILSDPTRTGWLVTQDPNLHWGDSDLHVGLLQNQVYTSFIQFNLSELPPGSKILYAALELNGRDASRLTNSGSWQVTLVDVLSKSDWAQITPDDITKAPSLAVIGAPVTAADLGADEINRFEFGANERQIFEKQLDAGVLNLRIQGPVSGSDSLFTWEGRTTRSINPPVLRIVAVPAPYIVVTSTPTPANVLTAAAVAATATSFVQQYGTPTRLHGGIATPTFAPDIVIVPPAATPANLATVQFQSAYATAVALTTGTFTPTPSNIRIVEPTATPLVILADRLTPIPTETPAPTRSDFALPVPPELKGKVLVYSNRYSVTPVPPSASTLILDQQSETERRSFGANAPIVLNPDNGQVIGLLSTDQPYLASVAREPYSPDLRQLAYVGSLSDDIPQIFLLDLASNVRTRITGVHPSALIGNVAAYSPAWSPNNHEVVYVSNQAGNDDIYVYDILTRTTRQLTNNMGTWNKRPSWSPDGQKIVFWSNRTGHPQIWVMSAMGTHQVNLSNNEFNDMNPVWVK